VKQNYNIALGYPPLMVILLLVQALRCRNYRHRLVFEQQPVGAVVSFLVVAFKLLFFDIAGKELFLE
jgi:hypothetical protein